MFHYLSMDIRWPVGRLSFRNFVMFVFVAKQRKTSQILRYAETKGEMKKRVKCGEINGLRGLNNRI